MITSINPTMPIINMTHAPMSSFFRKISGIMPAGLSVADGDGSSVNVGDGIIVLIGAGIFVDGRAVLISG